MYECLEFMAWQNLGNLEVRIALVKNCVLQMANTKAVSTQLRTIHWLCGIYALVSLLDLQDGLME